MVKMVVRARRRSYAFATLAALFFSLIQPVMALAQARPDELAGKEIGSIEYRGLRDYAEDSMNYYLELEVGKVYDPAELDRRLQYVWDKDILDDFAVSAKLVEGKVALVIAVKERPILDSIEYQGLDKVKRSDISEEADKERIDLLEGDPLNVGELVRLRKVIKDLYAQRGYRFADVAVEIENVDEGHRRVVITVDEGNKVKIGRVDFEGNEVFSAGRLRDAMKKTKKSNLITRLRKRDVYNPATVEEDLENVRDLYRRLGYKDVQTGDPVLEVVSKNPNADPSNQKRRLRIIIPIEEGPRWRLGEVRFEGNEVLKDEVLGRVFEQPKGGWLRSDVIEDGIEKIRDFYNNTGYIFASVEPEVVERDPEAQIADVVVRIGENDQFRVGRIEFEGNTRTQDKVLRRELRLQEGMVFNSASLKNSLLKVQQLEFFKLNEEDPVRTDFDTDKKVVNLTIQGDEAERNELQFGAGYSELDGFFGQASARTRNFLGRGETLGVSFQSGRFRNQFDLSYFVPWFLDKPQSLGFQIFKRDIDYDLLAGQRFVRNEKGAVLTYGRSFRIFESVSLSFSKTAVDSLQSFNLTGTPDGLIEQQAAFDQSSVTLAYRFDSHDSRLEPTRGKRAVAQVEYAGGPLGGESYLIHPRINLTYTTPVSRKGLLTVFRANLDASYVTPFGSDSDGVPNALQFYDKLQLGGESTIRGFQRYSIWVRDLDTGEIIPDPDPRFNGALVPQGGDKSVQFNFEYHFVAGGPFRVVTFLDAGNVFGEGQNVQLDKLRLVGGVELRINVPLFGAPLRFIWANLLNPYDNLPPGQKERFDSFDFSIGVSF